MTLSQGRPYLAIPGPSVMPDAVLAAMHRPAPNIYEGEIVELAAGLIPDLRAVARTKGHVAIYIGNGHAAWEAALANTVAPGDSVLVPATGRFGHGWADMAQGLGADVHMLDFGKSTPLDPAAVEAALRADGGHKIKAVLVTHVDTASSVLNDVAAVRAALDSAGHPALLMADCVASMAVDRFEMDAWGVDVAVAASQKGLMVPPGLGFVFFSDKAAQVRAAMPRVSRYWDWAPRAQPEQFYQYWGGTAPTHHLYGLRVALDMLHGEGIEAVWARHETLARTVWAACEAWGQGGGTLRLNVANPAHRARAVTALCLPQGGAGQLRKWCETQAGVTLGIGLGMAEPGSPAADDFFRIGHMGHVNAHMVLGMLGAVDAGLKALGLPHGSGAMAAATEVVAQATAVPPASSAAAAAAAAR